MSWLREGVWCSVDAETTGVDVETARIVTWSRWTLDTATGKARHLGWLINPGVPIPEEATAVHGITTERARAEGARPAVAVREIAEDLVWWAAEAATTVVFNAPYDLSLLHRECLRYGHTDLAEKVAQVGPILDPMVLDQRITPKRRGKGRRKLTAVAEIYGVPLGEDAHGSQADALAAARVGWKMLASRPALAALGPAGLHKAQVEWRAAQAAGLQAHLRKTNPDASVDPRWPFVPPPAPDPPPVQEALIP